MQNEKNQKKAHKKGNGFQKLMLTICGLSLAVILFAVLWGNGLLGPKSGADGAGCIAINKVGALADESHAQTVIANNRAELKNKVDEQIEINEEDAIIEAGSDNLDLDKYLVFVDDTHPLTQTYIDEHFPVITVVNDRGQEKQVEERAWYFYRRMKRYLEKEEGIIVDLDYGYRSIKGQQEIIDDMTEKYGAAYAWTYASVPGTSEHHTGLAIDLCLIVDGEVIDENVAMNAQTEIFGKIHEILPEYGFILDFPYESWHIRFVGSPEIAKAYYSGGMSFASFTEWYKQNH